MAGRPKAFKSADELKKRINSYIKERTADQRPMTMAGLAAHLEVCKDTLCEYQNGVYDIPGQEEYSEAIKKARTYIEADKLEQGLLNKHNATITIFDLKNNHGYADKHEMAGAGGEPLVPESRTDIEVARWLAFKLEKAARQIENAGESA